MNKETLISVAKSIVANQKGLLAADESNGTIKKRFDSIKLESTEENRRRYREILFTAEGIERYIGGVILFDETLRQKTKAGIPFPELLSSRGIVPGIKVDKGVKALALFPDDKITEGLDGLRERLIEYKKLGAKFAKWRAVININEKDIPTSFGIRANARALARYAAICQDLDIVPIVEPEVLMDGAHNMARCEAVTSNVLEVVFSELNAHGVLLEGMLLKPNMIIPGMKCTQQESAKEIAEATTRCLTRYVSAAVPGIVFLSGGQSAEDATENLNAINMAGLHPWPVSFSYGRALQAPVIAAWKGLEVNVPQAQKILLKRSKLNSMACSGKYLHSMEAAE